MDRRQFLGWFGVGTIATSLPLILAAYISDNKPAQASNKDKGEFKIFTTRKDLETKGIIEDKKTAAKPVVILVNPVDKKIVAFNPTCTHQGCTVSWQAKTKNLVCPCHGSKFNLEGKVTAGPAKQPLERFETKEENGKILVKVI